MKVSREAGLAVERGVAYMLERRGKEGWRERESARESEKLIKGIGPHDHGDCPIQNLEFVPTDVRSQRRYLQHRSLRSSLADRPWLGRLVFISTCVC